MTTAFIIIYITTTITTTIIRILVLLLLLLLLISLLLLLLLLSLLLLIITVMMLLYSLFCFFCRNEAQGLRSTFVGIIDAKHMGGGITVISPPPKSNCRHPFCARQTDVTRQASIDEATISIAGAYHFARVRRCDFFYEAGRLRAGKLLPKERGPFRPYVERRDSGLVSSRIKRLCVSAQRPKSGACGSGSFG